jgi:integrase
MRKKVTKRNVDALHIGDLIADTELVGFLARRLPSGQVVYYYRYRHGGRQRWLSLGLHGQLTPDSARRLAQQRAGEVAAGHDVQAEREAAQAREKMRVDTVLDDWLKHDVRKRGLRSASVIEGVIRNHIKPSIGSRPIDAVRRADILKMLDEVEKRTGSAQVQHVYAYTRAAFHWHETRHEGFKNPIIRSLWRSSSKARDRVLDDVELQVVWAAAETSGTYGAFIRLALLTGQRREKLLTMTRDSIAADGTWTIATEAREKGNPGELKLPKISLDIIRQQPRVEHNPYVLAGRGGGPIRGLSKLKRQFDSRLPAMPQWRIHDLRRSARSLMSRAGVDRDICERVVGHRVGDAVERIYDRHEYAGAKADALARLAALIESIVHPPAGNIVVALPLSA